MAWHTIFLLLHLLNSIKESYMKIPENHSFQKYEYGHGLYKERICPDGLHLMDSIRKESVQMIYEYENTEKKKYEYGHGLYKEELQ